MRVPDLITNFGIDGALAQVMYTKLYPDSLCYTVSKKKYSELICNTSMENKIVVGLPEQDINPPLISIYYSKEHSLTYQLAKYLNVQNTEPKLMKYALLADKLASYDESLDSLRNYYSTVGHDCFVSKFSQSSSVSLTKVEIALSQAYVSNVQALCDNTVENASYQYNGIVACRSNYSISYYLEDSIIRKYYDENDPESLMLMVLWTIDGSDIRITIRGKGDLSKKVLEVCPYKSDDSIVVPLSVYEESEEESINKWCCSIFSELVNQVLDNEKKEYYDRFDKLNAEYEATERKNLNEFESL